MRLLLSALLSLLLTAPAYAQEEWDLVRSAKQRDDVMTWVRPVPGNALKAFKGQVEVPHSLLTVFAVLGDIERFPEWVYQCDQARQLSELGHDISYVHIAGIWPVDDRDVVTRTQITQSPDTLAIKVATVAANGLMPLEKNTVRMPTLENSFIMEPLADGWTRITFETFVDPGGFIPSWLANVVAVRAPRDTLEGMYRLMDDAKYQINSVDQVALKSPNLKTLIFPSTPITTAPAADTQASAGDSPAS